MNIDLLGTWMGLIGCSVGLVLLIAYWVTGQKHSILRILGALLIMIGVIGQFVL